MKSKRTTVMISDEAWATLSVKAASIEADITVLCAELFEKYLMDPIQLKYKIPKWILNNRKQRTIYLPESTWVSLRSLKVIQRRSVSDILEQLIRTDTDLEIGEVYY